MNHLESNASPGNSIDANAVLWNLPPAERVGKPLLVMMHGLGSHEGDLFGLNRFLPPGLVVASLRAPLAYDGGFAWFQAGEQGGTDTTLLDGSVQGVLGWVDRLEVAPTSVALMGFSQGGCMALQLVRQAPERFAYVLQLSGFVANSAHPGDAALAARVPRMPVFWAHGDQDDVIALESVDRTRRWLDEHTTVQAHRYPMAHTVSQEELADLVDFVAARSAN
ncbi:MAG: alpha/beta hydrolase-fold protein [Terrimesophilobacter sp.]